MKAPPVIASNTYAKVIGDENSDVAKAAFRKIHALFPKALHLWWGANHFSDVFPDSSCWIVWDKENGESFFADAELAYCSADTSVRIFKHKWNGLLKASERGEKRVHPNQKPVALAVWCFEKYGEADDVIFDPFLGSGCSMLAAANLHRICYGMEISPDYCAVILDRMHRAFPDLEIKRVA